MRNLLFHTGLVLILITPFRVSAAQADSLQAGSAMEMARNWRDSLPDTALYYANRAELMLNRDDPGGQLPYLYQLKGSIYQERTVWERSLSYYKKAHEAFIREEEHEEAGNCALKLGNIYYELGDFSEAYSWYLQSLSAYERENDRMGIATMENNLGIVSHEMGKLDEAEKHYMNALEIYLSRGNESDQCRSMNNLGLIQYDRKDYDSALYYFRRGVEIMNDLEEPPGEDEQYILAGLLNNMALAYSDTEQYRKALGFLHEGLKLAERTEDPYNIGSVYINLGAVYGKLDRMDSAMYFFHRALKIAREKQYKHLEMEAYNELAQMNARFGSYASAYNWLLRYDTLNQEIFSEQQATQIARMRSRYEQELNEQEFEQVRNQAHVQLTLNKVLLGFIALTLILVALIAFNLRSRKRGNRELAERNRQLSEAMEQLSASSGELEALNRSKDRIFSVVAHDLRNPVAGVNGFAELLYENFGKLSPDTQKEYILQIVQGTQRVQNLLENLLIWARSQMKAIKFEPENLIVKEVVEDCLRELKVNLDHKKVQCDLNVSEECRILADRSMIHTIFRNLIMNAIKFSFPGGKIWINGSTANNSCTIVVADTGIGIEPEIQEKLFDPNETITSTGTSGEAGSGLGLLICQEFVEKNGGSIKVESRAGSGASFLVTLPVSAGS